MALYPMALNQGSAVPVPASTPDWMIEAGFWLALAAAVIAVVVAIGVWTLVHRAHLLRKDAERLGALDEIDRKVGRILLDRDDLDLRRLEHVLVDVRDAQRRLEDVLIRLLEARGAAGRSGETGQDLLLPAGAETVGERVTNRLLALGYERVQIVTRAEKLSELASKDGEVLVEARREGVLHKGRVLVRSGRLADVEIHPGYSIFP